MEPESSLPYSQEPVTGLYPMQDESSPYGNPMSLKSVLILSSQLRIGLPSSLLSSGVPTKTLYALIIISLSLSLIIFDLIYLIIFGKEYKLLNFSLCKFLQPTLIMRKRCKTTVHKLPRLSLGRGNVQQVYGLMNQPSL
jgi:hypothetical protein